MLIYLIVEAQFTSDNPWVEGNITLNGFIIQVMTGGLALYADLRGIQEAASKSVVFHNLLGMIHHIFTMKTRHFCM